MSIVKPTRTTVAVVEVLCVDDPFAFVAIPFHILPKAIHLAQIRDHHL